MSASARQLPGRLTLPAPERSAALEGLASFLPRAGRAYAGRRNFDYGPDDRSNVSVLSPYVTHRLILEEEILAAVLERHDPDAAQKFVEEVFWRAYFKGWLEHHPAVWRNYRRDLDSLLRRLDDDADLHADFSRAVQGETGIDCFDAWARELAATGYLHNHARMWFASIWVFTLGLPWQLGADFFYRHLLDGDPASNTLSWRWVCGLHTRGKTYLARVSNIASYTNDRFQPQGQLAVRSPALSEPHRTPFRRLAPADPAPPAGRYGLLITDADCLAESLGLERAPASILGLVTTGRRSSLPVSVGAFAFASGAVADGVERANAHFALDGVRVASKDCAGAIVEWATEESLESVVTAWAPVGPAAECLQAAAAGLATRNVRLSRLRRPYDEAAWPHATKGYFKLRAAIPAILDELGIGGRRDGQPDLFRNAS